ncbi:MAG: hypothetical protein KUG71_08805 [Porticoccaceae bacterium]|nr:hypothetical protein [Porticoccaceae bacterium]
MSAKQQVNNKTTLGEHAIVIGGSIAGLLTARVLSDYFERVTIFEADTPPDEAVPRKGVPQGSHVHGLLAGGGAVITKFFPDIHEDLLAAGVEYGDAMTDVRMFVGGRWSPRIESGINQYVMSRPLLEATVRKHTLAIPNVELRVATSVSAYAHSTRDAHGAGPTHSTREASSTTNATKTVVTGVTLEEGGESIAADFVADVSGRNSKASTWIEQLGYARPQRTTIGIDVGYVTFEMQGPPDKERDWSFVFTTPGSIPDETRGAGLFCIEGGRYLVTAAGNHKDYPPTDWAGFLAFLKGLPYPDIYEEIKDLQPIGEAKEYRYASYLRRHYEQLSDFPAGLVVLGDAMCSFNPIYGQGMTVAAKEAEYLDVCLLKCVENGNMDNLAQSFFAGAAKFIDAAWDGVTVEDFRYPQTRGDRPKGFAVAKWLNSKFFALSATDPEFAVAFSKVFHLMEPPSSVLKPKYLLKALFAKKPVYDKSPPAQRST